MDDGLSAKQKVPDECAKETFENYESDSKTYIDLVKAIVSSHNKLKDGKNKLDKWERDNT